MGYIHLAAVWRTDISGGKHIPEAPGKCGCQLEPIPSLEATINKH